ncbi:hypothetical protein XELAEV_18020127mg [Xenopus laevis]|uniref:Uncharacterized protein n=1 Tax=Xenopus laevis TaxID=8355 RepID=A0A974D6K0_XENLA|nr:hypothetical protein XELAEV_18020127mg [Xenopus laevis]
MKDFTAGQSDFGYQNVGERLKNISMSFSATHYLTKKNMTYAPVEVSVNPRPWELQTVLIVGIFGMVCLLHLMAFLFSLHFQHQSNGDPKSFACSLSEPKESKEDIMFLKL